MRRISIKKFRFPLEVLLRLRKTEENRALAELAGYLIRVNEMQSIKDKSATLVKEEMNIFEQKHRDDFNLDVFRIYDLYIERLENESLSAEEKLGELRPGLEELRNKVLEKSRRRRVVELLKKRHKDKYDYEFQKAERKMIEEVNRYRLKESILEEIPYETKSGIKKDISRIDAEHLEEIQEREEKIDALAQYYQRLGIPDPRQKGKN